jgi:hypothetical protein
MHSEEVIIRWLSEAGYADVNGHSCWSPFTAGISRAYPGRMLTECASTMAPARMEPSKSGRLRWVDLDTAALPFRFNSHTINFHFSDPLAWSERRNLRLPDCQSAPSQWGASGGSATRQGANSGSIGRLINSRPSLKHGCHQPTLASQCMSGQLSRVLCHCMASRNGQTGT